MVSSHEKWGSSQPQMFVCTDTYNGKICMSVTTFRTDVYISELKFVINYMRRMFLGNAWLMFNKFRISRKKRLEKVIDYTSTTCTLINSNNNNKKHQRENITSLPFSKWLRGSC